MAHKFKPETIERVQNAINQKRSNPVVSLTSAAKSQHTTTRTIRKVNEEFDLARIGKTGQRYDVSPYSNGEVLIFDSNDQIKYIEVSTKYARILGAYWGYIEWGNVEGMRKVARENIIRDTDGNTYRLSTNYDYINQLGYDNAELRDPFAGYTRSGTPPKSI